MEIQKIKIIASTLDEAKLKIDKSIPDGFILSSEEIVCDGKSNEILIHAHSIDTALRIAKEKIPIDSKIIDTKIVKKGVEKVIAIDAWSEDDAWCVTDDKIKSQKGFSDKYLVLNINLVDEGSKGFWGIGKERNKYNVTYKFQDEILIEYQPPAIINITCKLKELAESPISRERMDLLWINPDELDLLEIALKTRTSVPVMLGPEKGGPKTISGTKKDIEWAKSIDRISARASAAYSRGDYNNARAYYT